MVANHLKMCSYKEKKDSYASCFRGEVSEGDDDRKVKRNPRCGSVIQSNDLPIYAILWKERILGLKSKKTKKI